PQLGTPSPALLMHDRVPGGTGYLAGFTSPHQVWELLHSAWEAVRDCPCAEENRLACPKCLLPHSSPGDVDRTSRAAAETALLALLSGGGHDDTAPSRDDWTIVETQEEDKLGDSALEVRFRHAFRTALENAGAKVTELPAGKYSKLQIRMSGSEVTWDLQAQVDAPGALTRPDYVLRPDNTNLATFAIYADGAKYHATPQYNRVADDVDKREAIRDIGWVPWVITHEDLTQFESLDPAATWENTALATNLCTTLGVAPSRFNIASGDPVTLLVRYLLDPDVPQWHSVGDVSAAYGLATSKRRGDLRETIRSHTRATFTGDPRKPSSLKVDLAIDASDDAVASDGYLADWRWFLRWSNLLSLRKTRSSIRVLDELVVVTEPDVSVAAKPEASVSTEATAVVLTAEWQELAEQIEPDLDESARERELIELLAPLDGPVRDYGEELAGQIASFSWPDKRIAVIVSDSDDMVRSLTSGGWYVIDGSADDVAGQLQNALSGET